MVKSYPMASLIGHQCRNHVSIFQVVLFDSRIGDQGEPLLRAEVSAER